MYDETFKEHFGESFEELTGRLNTPSRDLNIGIEWATE